MASSSIKIRICLPGDDPAPALQASAISPGSADRYTYHHILPWRYCAGIGNLLLKLAAYGEASAHRPRFGGAAPLDGESVGDLFAHTGDQTRKRLVTSATGMIQAGADLSRNRRGDDDLTQFMQRPAAGGGSQLDGWLAFQADGTGQDALGRFSRPPFAGFWGMLPEQRADDPKSAPESVLPASMPEQKQARLRALIAAAQNLFAGTPPPSGSSVVATSSDAVRALLIALEPLLGRDNQVHPFEPSDWTFRRRGDSTFREKWWFVEWEELHRMQPFNRFQSEQCRVRSFALRRGGETVTGQRLAPPASGPVPTPLVWNEAEISGRARFCVY